MASAVDSAVPLSGSEWPVLVKTSKIVGVKKQRAPKSMIVGVNPEVSPTPVIESPIPSITKERGVEIVAPTVERKIDLDAVAEAFGTAVAPEEEPRSQFQFRNDYMPPSSRHITDRETRSKVASILSIEDKDEHWMLVAGYGDVVMTAPNKDLLPIRSALKGLAIDTRFGNIVLQSFPYAAVAVADELRPDSQGLIHLTDNYGTRHQLVARDMKISPMFEGPIINVGWYNGQMFFANSSKFHAQTATRGCSAKLGETYKIAGGPPAEMLFDTKKKYSPYSYSFLISAKGWLTASRLDVGQGRIIFLGRFCNWNPSLPPYPTEECDLLPHYGFEHPTVIREMPHLFIDQNDLDDYEIPTVFAPENMSLAEANNFLRNGFNMFAEGQRLQTGSEPAFGTDHPFGSRLGPGEALVIEDIRGTRLQVNSRAYDWRRSIRGEGASVKAEFFTRTADARLDQEAFDRKYPEFVALDLEAVAEAVRGKLASSEPSEDLTPAIDPRPILTWPSEGKLKMPRTTFEERLDIIQIAMLMSCPLNEQINALTLADDFVEQRKFVADTLFAIDLRRKVPQNIRDIYDSGFALAQKEINRRQAELKAIRRMPQNMRKKTESLSMDDSLIREKIAHFAMTELPGFEIHRIAKYFHREEKFSDQ